MLGQISAAAMTVPCSAGVFQASARTSALGAARGNLTGHVGCIQFQASASTPILSAQRSALRRGSLTGHFGLIKANGRHDDPRRSTASNTGERRETVPFHVKQEANSWSSSTR